ncbi:hypothetical protein N7463_007008 [Penicillium fimorum]|uniref:Xylanolytic transcriptional activator regulatory domain-containing protein n=1 Tax=Penicillium fimorum TaxID=1882269 RepID=A0A9W9XVV4_9EURO|nr:hypothetical protein N7463_007008 [Penicillium fimorum]
MDGLQAILMLMIFHCSSGNLQFALYLNSLIAQLVFILGAHLRYLPATNGAPLSVTTEAYQTTRHLRNLFWTAYVLDKELSLRAGQPVAIHDEDCDLSLPPGYEEQLYILLSSSESDGMVIGSPLFPTDLRLIKIRSRAYTTLYQPGSFCEPGIKLESIRQLDSDLEMWRVSLPLKCRPGLLTSQLIATGNTIADIHILVVRMDYHHCMAMIHQASGRCKAWTGTQNNTIDGVDLSFKIAVETSRSSIISLQNSLHVTPNSAFWLLVFYPISASFAIFCGILLDPSDPDARQDLKLLHQTVNLIKGLPLPQLSGAMHVARFVRLVFELCRLANLAITEAEKKLFGSDPRE